MNTKSYQIYIYQIVNNLGFKQKKRTFLSSFLIIMYLLRQ